MLTIANVVAHLPFTQQMQTFEANVRGTYLNIASDTERVLVDLVLISQYDKVKKPKHTKAERNYIIREYSMNKKLTEAKKGIKNKYPHHYKSLTKAFKAVSKLVEWRNILAHGFSEYDPANKNKTYIIFRAVDDKLKDNVQRIQITPFINMLEKYRLSIIALYEIIPVLISEIEKDYNS